jgi:hypothetical protein
VRTDRAQNTRSARQDCESQLIPQRVKFIPRGTALLQEQFIAFCDGAQKSDAHSGRLLHLLKMAKSRYTFWIAIDAQEIA